MLREGTSPGGGRTPAAGAPTLAPSRAGVDRKERLGAARFFPAEPRGAPTRTDPHHRHIGLAGSERAPGSNRRPQEAPEGPRE